MDIPDTHYRCATCKIVKPKVGGFHARKARPSGVQSSCIDCQRDKRAKQPQRTTYVEKVPKPCSECKIVKTPSHFGKQAQAPDGLAWTCRDCVRDKRTRVEVAAIGGKPCSDCKVVLPLARFHKNPKMGDGRLNRCKRCASDADKAKRSSGEGDAIRRADRDRYAKKSHEERRNSALISKFGITLGEYDEMYRKQAGLCGICRQPESALIRGIVVALAVDHCHATGKIRGLLCSNCNNGLGRFSDNPTSLRSAAEWVESEGWKPE